MQIFKRVFYEVHLHAESQTLQADRRSERALARNRRQEQWQWQAKCTASLWVGRILLAAPLLCSTARTAASMQQTPANDKRTYFSMYYSMLLLYRHHDHLDKLDRWASAATNYFTSNQSHYSIYKRIQYCYFIILIVKIAVRSQCTVIILFS